MQTALAAQELTWAEDGASRSVQNGAKFQANCERGEAQVQDLEDNARVRREAHAQRTEAEASEHGSDPTDRVVEADEVVQFFLPDLQRLDLELRQGGVFVCRQHFCFFFATK